MEEAFMSPIRAFDHVGITVADLDRVTALFIGLGLEVEGTRMFVEGEFLDTLIGIPNARTEIVMLRPPGGGTRKCGLALKADGLRARTGGHHRDPGRADRLTSTAGAAKDRTCLG
jgi:catechol 2,3-dioxygenase-like lactoylglutathione lyase family enzyme